ncbi:whirlin-like, partial [Stegodyphus dumicola]|uniref:whirlin-like n=1 Tax=Stegodyphus dumicola TaxID=202533 RepID=UPI0015ACCD8B
MAPIGPMWDPALSLENSSACVCRSGSSARCDICPEIRQWFRRSPVCQERSLLSREPSDYRYQGLRAFNDKLRKQSSLHRFEEERKVLKRRKELSGIYSRHFRYYDALQVLDSSRGLSSTDLGGKSLPFSRRGPRFRNSVYMWVDRNGRPVSPPSSHSRSPSYKEKAPLKKVMVSVEEGLSLGFMIRGGAEYGLGIYITGVDESSAADLAGLQFGDQIISVNDIDFTNITHDEAVTLLQSSPHMSMVVRSEGRVPHSTIPYSPNETAASSSAWYTENRPELSRKGSPRKRDHKAEETKSSNSETAEHRLERKARKLLTESQRITLAYYCNEYETGAMPVDSFLSVLLEQLDTPEKYTLMTEVRSLVRGEDLDKFDELIYRRELQAMKSKETMKLAVEIHTEHADDNVSPP